MYKSWGPGHILQNVFIWQLGAWTSPAKYFIMTAGALDISSKILCYDSRVPGQLQQNTLLWQLGPCMDISCKILHYDSWGPGHLLQNIFLRHLGPWTSPAKHFIMTAGALEIPCKIRNYDKWGPGHLSRALVISCKILYYDSRGPGHLSQNTLLWQQGPWTSPKKYFIMTAGALDIPCNICVWSLGCRIADSCYIFYCSLWWICFLKHPKIIFHCLNFFMNYIFICVWKSLEFCLISVIFSP